MPKKKAKPKHGPGRQRLGTLPEVRGTDAARFGQHFEKLLDESGLSVPEFAVRTGMRKQIIYRYIRGERIPPFSKWREIAAALGLRKVNDLLPDLPIGH